MRSRSAVVFALAVAVMVLAGGAFIHKMTEFVATMAGTEVAGFGAVAVAVYLTGMVPLLFLTLWALLGGRFRDIERPASRMLELHREIEAAEGGNRVG